MEGAPSPYPTLSPANLVIMNVVSQFTVYDSVLGVRRQPGPGNIVSLWTSVQEERGRQEGVGIPGLLQEVANSAPCHQQLPILGIKYTGAQELGYRSQVVESKIVGPLGAWC